MGIIAKFLKVLPKLFKNEKFKKYVLEQFKVKNLAELRTTVTKMAKENPLSTAYVVGDSLLSIGPDLYNYFTEDEMTEIASEIEKAEAGKELSKIKDFAGKVADSQVSSMRMDSKKLLESANQTKKSLYITDTIVAYLGLPDNIAEELCNCINSVSSVDWEVRSKLKG